VVKSKWTNDVTVQTNEASVKGDPNTIKGTQLAADGAIIAGSARLRRRLLQFNREYWSNTTSRRMQSSTSLSNLDASCYSIVQNAEGIVVGQLIGNCVGLEPARTLDGPVELCVPINTAISTNPAFTTKDFATQKSEGKFEVAGLSLTSKSTNLQLCANVQTAIVYCPIQRYQSYSGGNVDAADSSCSNLEQIQASVNAKKEEVVNSGGAAAAKEKMGLVQKGEKVKETSNDFDSDDGEGVAVFGSAGEIEDVEEFADNVKDTKSVDEKTKEDAAAAGVDTSGSGSGDTSSGDEDIFKDSTPKPVVYVQSQLQIVQEFEEGTTKESLMADGDFLKSLKEGIKAGFERAGAAAMKLGDIDIVGLDLKAVRRLADMDGHMTRRLGQSALVVDYHLKVEDTSAATTMMQLIASPDKRSEFEGEFSQVYATQREAQTGTRPIVAVTQSASATTATETVTKGPSTDEDGTTPKMDTSDASCVMSINGIVTFILVLFVTP
jgi:hypothetical protein